MRNKVLHQNLANPKSTLLEDAHNAQHLLWDCCLFPKLVDLSQPHFTRLYWRFFCKAINAVCLQTPWWTQSLQGLTVPVLLQWQTPSKFGSNLPTRFPAHAISPVGDPAPLSHKYLWMALGCPTQPGEVNPVPEPGETPLMTGPSWSYPAPLRPELSCHCQNKPAQHFPIRSR